jgi:galactokinase/mevalonate kinase-like predicted kinase
MVNKIIEDNDLKSFKEVVRISIKNEKCNECLHFPEAIIKNNIVTFDIDCNKNCENKKYIQSIIDNAFVNYVSVFKK